MANSVYLQTLVTFVAVTFAQTLSIQWEFRFPSLEARAALVPFLEAWIQRRTWRITTIHVVTSQEDAWGQSKMNNAWKSGRPGKRKRRSLWQKNLSSMSSKRRSFRRQFTLIIIRLMRNTNCKFHREPLWLQRVFKKPRSRSWLEKRDCIKILKIRRLLK